MHQSFVGSRGTLALPYLVRAEKIRFIVVGITAAVLQGTPVVTFDVALWIDLPSRQYMRVQDTRPAPPEIEHHLKILNFEPELTAANVLGSNHESPWVHSFAPLNCSSPLRRSRVSG